MRGSVLITGETQKARLDKAWELLAPCGFFPTTHSPDLLHIQKEGDKKSIGIAQAKEVKKFLQERPFEKSIKAIVIEDAHLLTDDAQGSLLKILEEPPIFGLILLMSPEEGLLLSTVVSRCQKLVIKSSAASTPSLIYRLQDKSYKELFDLAKEMSQKDKETVIGFLEGVLRYDVCNGASVALVKTLDVTIREIKTANVALKFTLEYLFLLHKFHDMSL